MTVAAVLSPFPQFFGVDGKPLTGGKLYFGRPNENPETAPVTVYWDAAGTQPAAQPIVTLNGYAARAGTMAQIFAPTDCSITVRTKRGELVFYKPTLDGFGFDEAIFQNPIVIDHNVSIRDGNNGMSAGPISIADGATVTIPTGSAWSIV